MGTKYATASTATSFSGVSKAKPAQIEQVKKVDHYLYVKFSREKPEETFTSFRVASSLDSLKQNPSDIEKEDQSDDESKDQSKVDSGFPELCSKFIDRFEAELSKYRDLISIITLIGGSMATGGLEAQVLPEAKKHGVQIEGDELSEIYGLSDNGFESVLKQFHRMNEINAGLAALPSSLLLSLVATFDSLTGDFINEILRSDPSKVKFSEKTITYRELFQSNDVSKILNDAIENEVNQLLRRSHQEQISYIENLIETKISGKYDRISNYLEIFERRNQFAHAAGVVTDRYIERCKSFKSPVDGMKVGDNFNLGPKYLHRAVDYLSEFGIIFAFIAWRKLGEKSPQPFIKLNEVCFELIVKRRYRLAIYLLDFALHRQNCNADDITKRMMHVNLANSYARSGKAELARKTLDELEWTACSDDFKICVAAVQGDIEQVCQILPRAVASKAISKSSLRTWPVFDNINETKEFATAFEEAFSEPYQVELVSGSTLDAVEIANDDGPDLNSGKSVH